MAGGLEARDIGLQELEHVFQRGGSTDRFFDTEAQSVRLVIVVVRIYD